MSSIEKSLLLPKTSIKRIMKLSDEVSNVSAEAVGLVSKATEEFLSELVKRSVDSCIEGNRKMIKIDDLYEVIKKDRERYEFLVTTFGETHFNSEK